jgi:hypothetical protein
MGLYLSDDPGADLHQPLVEPVQEAEGGDFLRCAAGVRAVRNRERCVCAHLISLVSQICAVFVLPGVHL